MSQFEIPFMTLCIQAFSQRFSLSLQAAYAYLRQHNGISFLTKHYEVEHLQSIEDTIDDLIIICNKNGGTIG